MGRIIFLVGAGGFLGSIADILWQSRSLSISPLHFFLIAVDGIETSVRAAKKGLELSHELNAHAGLIFVIDTAKAIGNPDTGITHADAILVLNKEAEQTLDQLADMFNGQELRKFMPEGHPIDEIINTAKGWEADMIVMGTHGYGGSRHLLFGSVAEHVIRHAHRPVMVVPSKA